MWRKNSWCLAVILGIFLLVSMSFVSAEVRINEVELNPTGKDSGNEWLELYSEEEVDLEDWKIVNKGGREFVFSCSFSGYYVLDTPYLLLTNKDQKLSLINSDGDVVDETDNIEDNYHNDERSWQFCNSEWLFIDSTKEEENACPESEDEDEDEGDVVDEEAPAEEDDEDEDDDEDENEEDDEGETEIKELVEDKKPVEKTEQKEPEEEKVITLNNPKNIKGYTVKEYKSTTQYIKEYGIYAFALFLCFVIIYLLIKRK